MSYSNAWKSGTAVLVALGMTAGTVAPLVMPAPAFAQTAFPDVASNYWAAPFIQELVNRGIIAGFSEDGTFRPEEPVTRAQFAAMIRRAFNRPPTRNPINFVDVPANYWGRAAIEEAYTSGFLAGYPGNEFRPNENIPRAQVLVSLSSGLGYASSQPADTVLLAFNDAGVIPAFARPGVAAAAERQLVVNYPDVKTLNPNRQATRAEVAAFIYQALVSAGQAAAIPSPYIVGQVTAPQQVRIPAGTTIPVRYEGTDRVVIATGETQPRELTLRVARNIVTNQGQVLIPAGSSVIGVLQPVQGGAQFSAREFVLSNGQRITVNAASEVVNRTETISSGTNVGRIIAGTVVGAGAAAGVAGVTGDRTIRAGEVLIGAGAGALAGVLFGRDRTEGFVINPNTDLTLTLGSDLVIAPNR